MDPGQFEDRPHRTACDDPRTGRGRLEHHPSGTDLHRHGVGDRAFDHRDGHEFLASLFDALADGFGHFAGLTDGEADFPLLVADHDERGKAEPLAALDDLGHAVDAHDGLFESLVVAVATAPIIHALKFQSGFARGRGERRDPAVILAA